MKATQANDNPSFGAWVQQRRLALDLTRPALAQRVHCSPSTIKKIERDERRPSHPVAELLADHLLIPDRDRTVAVAISSTSLGVRPRHTDQAHHRNRQCQPPHRPQSIQQPWPN